MKVLIWIGSFIACLSATILCDVLLAPFGLRLGWLLRYLISVPAMTILAKFLCKKWDIRVVRKEAYSKGLSIRQYIESIVPSSVMYVCETQKGNPSDLKKSLKKCVESDAITKRISTVLFEMYK